MIIIKEKSFAFAVRIVKFHELLKKRKDSVLGRQILRSGTSVGANVREAINAQSDADFISKLSIAQKECDETIYWLELLKETEKINIVEFESLHKDAVALLKIIRSIILTKKKNMNK
jgi:four helix bundle protein